jgi:hypothetical protein
MRTLLLALTACISFAFAQDGYFRIPDGLVRHEGGAVTLRTPQGELVYIEGLGWSVPTPLGEPLVTPDGVYAPEDLLRHLGIFEPTLSGVRFGGGGTVRVVLDIAGLGASALGLAEQRGRLEDGETLTLALPRLLLPQEQPDPYRGVDVTLAATGGGTRAQVSAGEASYHVFTLENPTRVVIDVTPHAAATVTAETRELRPGVVYRQFAAPTAIGSSAVHVLEIAPGSGEFRVVGANEAPLPVSQLTSGAFAGINAGYFDTRTFGAIGLLKVDHGLLSLPSRQRASIGFAQGQAVIDRVVARVSVRVGGQLYSGSLLGENAPIQVVTGAGQAAGNPTQGVITVQSGSVLANRVGPLPVPPGGFAIVYEPDQRELALVERGASASYAVSFDPPVFGNLRYAVEAGPLLVAGGLPAFDPDLEQFRRGERILDDYTQQAAIGVRADGTVLFVAADNMIAEELVPLMLGLGAQDAMRLDSGGSTTLVVDGRVLNRRGERRVVSAIVFVPNAN